MKNLRPNPLGSLLLMIAQALGIVALIGLGAMSLWVVA